MRTRIDIDTQTFVRFWLVVIAFVLGLYAITLASTGLIILGVSFFLALALSRPVAKIASMLPGKSRVAATAIAYIAVVLILGSVIFLVVPPIIQQTARFIETLPSVIDGSITQWRGLNSLIEQYNLQSQVNDVLATIQSSASSWAGNVGQNVVAGIGSFFNFIGALILVLVLTFLMLVEGPRWMTRIWGLYTDRDRRTKHQRIIGRMYNVVTGYVTGQLTVSSIGSVFAGLTVFILSLFFSIPPDLAFSTAAITFLFSLIPMFGAMIGGAIITALLAFNSVPAAIAYAIYFVIYQQIENNFISPNIQAKRIELSALAILGAVTIGLYMFGVVGGIIAIPIAGSLRVLLDEHLMAAKQRRIEGGDKDDDSADMTVTVVKEKKKKKRAA
jgi:predicted PurR-regulated permease PerM